MNYYAGILGRTLDVNSTDRCVAQFLSNVRSNADIGIYIVSVLATLSVPSRCPILHNSESNTNRMYLLAHCIHPLPSVTVIVI